MKNTSTHNRKLVKEELIDSVLRGHIRSVIHQLRLRVSQIELENTGFEEEQALAKVLKGDYYYKKLLPLVICDSIKEQYCYINKKVLQDGVMTDVRKVCL